MSDLPTDFVLIPEQPTQVDMTMADGVFVKQIVIPRAGTYVPQHSHTYDHTSMLALGSMRVWQDGVLLGDYTAPKALLIPAHTKHTFLALTDGTMVYCIHNVSRTGVMEIQEEHSLL